MKLLSTLFISVLCLYSCKSKINKNILPICLNQNQIIKDTLFFNTDILIGTKYNDSCNLSSINFIFKVDERSGVIKRSTDLKKLVIDGGYIDRNNHNLFFSQKTIDNFYFDGKNNLVSGEFNIDSKLDSINFITINTVSYNLKSKKKIVSPFYTYRNSLALIGFENSYMDYKAFKETNIKFKDLTLNKKQIDSILITVKNQEFIDDLTNYNVTINDTLNFNFRNSIKAGFNDFKLMDNNVNMFNFLKMNEHFFTFKLDLHKISLKSVDSIKINVN